MPPDGFDAIAIVVAFGVPWYPGIRLTHCLHLRSGPVSSLREADRPACAEELPRSSRRPDFWAAPLHGLHVRMAMGFDRSESI